MNSLDPDSPSASPVDVKEILQEDSFESIGQDIIDFCEAT